MARITGGKARGRVLREAVAEGVRPTSERAREALFSMLGQDLSGEIVLDAFGGTGLLGLEAWSRGARVTVVERDRKVGQGIVTRAETLGARPPEFQVRPGDALAVAAKMGPFDGILCDPPWADDPAPVIAALGPLARSWFVFEADEKSVCPDRAGDLPLDRVRKYGRAAFWIYRAARSEPDDAADEESAD